MFHSTCCCTTSMRSMWLSLLIITLRQLATICVSQVQASHGRKNTKRCTFMSLVLRHGRPKVKGDHDEAGDSAKDNMNNQVRVQAAMCITLGSTACRYDVIWIQWALLYLTDGKAMVHISCIWCHSYYAPLQQCCWCWALHTCCLGRASQASIFESRLLMNGSECRRCTGIFSSMQNWPEAWWLRGGQGEHMQTHRVCGRQGRF